MSVTFLRTRCAVCVTAISAGQLPIPGPERSLLQAKHCCDNRFRRIVLHAILGTSVAQVADVSMKDGKVRVHRVVCAVDCGVAVNPDVIRAQMEGGIGFAMSALYYGEIEIEAGRAVQRNFDRY